MVCGRGNGLVYLANPDRIDLIRAGDSDPVGFPIEDCYSFDEATFSRLRSEWEASGKAHGWGAPYLPNALACRGYYQA